MKISVYTLLRITLITCVLAFEIDYLLSSYANNSFENYGLKLLFNLRGTRPTPDNVAIIAMDEQSESRLGLGNDLTLWRTHHANLIKILTQQGVKLIIFDLQFSKSFPAIDKQLAKAMHSSGNVLLTNCVQKFLQGDQAFYGREDCSENYKHAPVEKSGQTQQALSKQLIAAREIPATAELANAALARGSFLLTNDPEHQTIEEVWVFFDFLANSPALPLVAWLYDLQAQGQLAAIPWLTPPYELSLAVQRRLCLGNFAKFTAQLGQESALQQRLIKLICQEDSRYLNYYGPPRSLRMESYSDVLDHKVTDLKDKVVFIGKAYRQYAAGRIDVFPSPFDDGMLGKMSGIEIMASEFANLQNDEFVSWPVANAVILLVFGLVISCLLTAYSGLRGIVFCLLFTLIYLSLAVWCFTRYAIYLPIAIPVAVQLPLAMLISLWESLRLWRPASTTSKTVDSVCLATDIAGYTTVTEQLKAVQIAKLIDSFHKVLNQVVRLHHGKVNDFAGDAMMAYWAEMPRDKLSQTACLAAVDILAAVDRFNSLSPIALPIRIGLYAGEIRLRTIVSGNTFLYRGVGNTLTIASRIEGINKLLSSRILVSKSIQENTTGVFCRNVGSFKVKGSKQALELFEVIGFTEDITQIQQAKFQHFAHSLTAFQHGQWQTAAVSLQALLTAYGADGPSQYYLKLALAYQIKPPLNWAGYVVLKSK